jgi:CHRD domain
MRVRALIGIAAAAAAFLVVAVAPSGANGGGNFKASLIGYEEVPAVSTDATGTFEAKVVETESGPVIEYELTYSDVPANVLFAHIHLGQFSANGGVSAFLCEGGDKPACPENSGTVTGTIDAADVIGPATQGITAGQIEELIDAMVFGVTYANVHSMTHPGGEIRGQIR